MADEIKVSGLVEKFGRAVGAFMWPKVEVWLNTVFMPGVQQTLSHKIDELIPDQIDKVMLPQLNKFLTDLIPNSLEDIFKRFPLGGLFR